MAEWCTIESDPAVFEEMIRDMGVEGVQVREIFTLDYDPAFYAALEPLYGFIFLFKWVPLPPESDSVPLADPQPFFAVQVVQNACATQALLSVLLNQDDNVHLGPRMQQFKDFCAELDPYSRGLSIGDSDFIREVHNSFRSRKFFEVEPTKDGPTDDAFHFIAYVTHGGQVCELDGLQKAPRGLAPAAEGHSWIKTTLEHIARRVGTYDKSEIRFTLLAVVQDPRVRLEREQVQLKEEIARLQDNEEARDAVVALLDEVVRALQQCSEDVAARKAANARKKHNYFPLLFALLEEAARSGRLESLMAEAVQRLTPK